MDSILIKERLIDSEVADSLRRYRFVVTENAEVQVVRRNAVTAGTKGFLARVPYYFIELVGYSDFHILNSSLRHPAGVTPERLSG